jgi:hypothetical protein
MANGGKVSSVSQRGLYEPFHLQVSRGQIALHERFCPFGFNTAVTTSETVWSPGGLYTFPAAASVLTVVSDDADDDAGDTGALTVTIEGLDANYEPVSATVTMDGTNNVSTTGVSFLRVNRAYVATAGSTGTNEGTITIANSAPTTLASIAPGAGIAEQCVYTVPAGKTAYIGSFMISSYNSTAGAGTAGQIFVRPFGGAFLLATTVRIPGNGAFTCGAEYPFPVTEKSDIDFRAIALAGTSNVSAQLQMVVIQNEYDITGG